jgi:K+-transporting ATPase A subunit
MWIGDGTWLADVFEEHRAHLRAVAYRMLGSTGVPPYGAELSLGFEGPRALSEVMAFFAPHRDKSPMAVGFGLVSRARWRARARLVIVVIAIAAMPTSAAVV